MNLSEFPPVDLKTIDRDVEWVTIKTGGHNNYRAYVNNTMVWVGEFPSGYWWRFCSVSESQSFQKLGATTLEEAKATALVLWRMR